MHERMGELLKNAGIAGDSGRVSLSGLASSGNGSAQGTAVSDAIKQATQQLQDLHSVTQSNVDSLAANTGALANNTESHTSSTGGVTSTLANAATGLLGGGGGLGGLLGGGLLGGIFSLFSGLFGHHASEPAPLTKYQAPEAQNFSLASSGGQLQDAVSDSYGQTRSSSVTELALQGVVSASGPSGSGNGGSSQASSSGQQPTSHVTVNVNAMDSRSFMDHSNDIAQAVKEAMLNMHSINDVVSDL